MDDKGKQETTLELFIIKYYKKFSVLLQYLTATFEDERHTLYKYTYTFVDKHKKGRQSVRTCRTKRYGVDLVPRFGQRWTKGVLFAWSEFRQISIYENETGNNKKKT